MAALDITPLGGTAWVTGTTPVSATYPSGLLQDDIVYLICSSKPGGTAPTTPTNWTSVGSAQVGSGTAGVGTGPTQVTVFRRVVPSGGLSGTQAVALTGANVMSVCMQGYRASGDSVVWATEQWWTASAAASTTPAFAATVSASTVDAKDVLGWVVSVTDDTGTDITHTSASLTGATFGTAVRAPDAFASSTTGQDIGSAAFYMPVATGPNSGTTLTLTENITASETSGVGVWRIRASGTPLALRQQVLQWANASPNQVSFPVTPTAGNLVLVAISRWSGTDPTIASNAVTDNQGNTYAPAVNITANGDRGIAIFYAQNVAASGTFTVSAALTDSNVGIMEFTSAATSGSLDQSNSGTGTSTTPSAGSVTTSAASEIYLAVAWSLTDGDSWAAGSGWRLLATDVNNSSRSRYATEWQQSAAGTYTGDFTTGAGTAWGAVIASFRTATTASASLVFPRRPTRGLILR